MNSALRANHESAHHGQGIDRKITRYTMPILVRPKYGEEYSGTHMHRDGLSFHSAHPIPVGRVVELILCGGSILVDAEVTACEPALDGGAGFMIRTEFQHTSQEMRQLIQEEMTRHQQEA